MPPTSQDLVPTNQPYGNRQENVAAMQQGGVPTSTTPPPPPGQPSPGGGGPPALLPGGPSSPPMSGLDLLRGHTPADFPFIDSPQTTSQPAEEPDSVTSALAASAQSSFARAVMARLQSRR
jgi:hypothetical protein